MHSHTNQGVRTLGDYIARIEPSGPTTHVIVHSEAFELLLETARTRAGTTLSFKTRRATSNNQDPHTKFQVTLSPADLHRLRNAIDEAITHATT